jgi:hypothetical protein
VTTVADMTMCTVSFGDWPVIDVNRRLLERMNPGVQVQWRVARNLPLQPPDGDAGGAHVEVIEGEALDDDLRATSKHRSWHHALGLNRVCRDVRTRYLALVDADCFIVRPHWVRDVLGHMREHGLAFFGVPYHPRSIAKIRYLPCAVFIVIDTTQMAADALDWTPKALTPRRPDGPVDRWLQRRLQDDGTAWRLRAEESEDTGIRVYAQLREDGLSSECAVPVYTTLHAPRKLRTPRQLALEHVLPDRYCILPKRRGAITDRGFVANGLEDFSGEGCEEYMWRDDPFALHLRGGPEELRSSPEKIQETLWRFPTP